jgi:hypothetical protein
VPRRHLPWCAHSFAGGPSGGGDAEEGGGELLEVAAARVPPVSPEEGDAGVVDSFFALLLLFSKNWMIASLKKLLPSKYEPLTKIQYNLILTKNQLSFYVNNHEVPTKTLLASN